MRTGYEKGYDVITLKDCTAALSEEEQRLAVEKNYPMFSRPMEHTEFLAELGGEKVVETENRGYSVRPVRSVQQLLRENCNFPCTDQAPLAI